ncbi:hypothetical protein FRC11_013125, partial [Ceratobasidium sp. 423]
MTDRMSPRVPPDSNSGNEVATLVPPQLSPFLSNLFNLKPVVGNPSREEVKLVHEAPATGKNTPSMYCQTWVANPFDSHSIKNYDPCLAVQNIVYDPPVLPNYIPVELKSVTGPPSNEEIASVHTALRISESFVNVPSVFDSDAHVQLSQHLFDLQFARHVERSIVKRIASVIPAPQNQTTSHRNTDDTGARNRLAVQVPLDTPQEIIESTEAQHPALEQPNLSIEAPSHPNLNES